LLERVMAAATWESANLWTPTMVHYSGYEQVRLNTPPSINPNPRTSQRYLCVAAGTITRDHEHRVQHRRQKRVRDAQLDSDQEKVSELKV
jgi:hypothetical protein